MLEPSNENLDCDVLFPELQLLESSSDFEQEDSSEASSPRLEKELSDEESTKPKSKHHKDVRSIVMAIEEKLKALQSRYFKDSDLKYDIYRFHKAKSSKTLSSLIIKFEISNQIKTLETLMSVIHNYNMVLFESKNQKFFIAMHFKRIRNGKFIGAGKVDNPESPYLNLIKDEIIKGYCLYYNLTDFLKTSEYYPIDKYINYIIGAHIIELLVRLNNIGKHDIFAIENLLKKLSKSYINLIISIRFENMFYLNNQIKEEVVIMTVFLSQFNENSVKEMLADILCIEDIDLHKFQNSKAIIREENKQLNGFRLGFKNTSDLLFPFYSEYKKKTIINKHDQAPKDKPPKKHKTL